MINRSSSHLDSPSRTSTGSRQRDIGICTIRLIFRWRRKPMLRRAGPRWGLHASFELRTRAGIPKIGPIEPELATTLKHAYLACVSYVDAQIGCMIGALDEAGIRDNTIIIVWGDHGWHLGDMGVWGKATNYEIATRVPLMIWTPDMKTRGESTDALVELVDMYPTLCELAGLPIPEHVEGHSFVPLLDKPDQDLEEGGLQPVPQPGVERVGGESAVAWHARDVVRTAD